MPVVALNLAVATFSEIRALVERGLYGSLEQFLEIAAFNQLALERGVKPEELLQLAPTIQASRGGQVTNTQKRREGNPSNNDASRIKVAVVARRAGQGDQWDDSSDQLWVQVRGRLSLRVATEHLPESISMSARPKDERIWGQVNRLFPLKLACRWLATASADKKAWSPLSTISDRMADDAAIFGSHWSEFDGTRLGRSRDESYGTGLPRRGNAASRDRFLSQFIARTTRAGHIYPGAICQYSLAAFDGERLGLTSAGVELARMDNPLIDSNDDVPPPASALSEDERALFIGQIVAYVPSERRDFQTVLRAVEQGRRTPGEVLAAMRSELPAEWSDLNVRTHVSGVIARMVEGGLLSREWEGRNVHYAISESAAKLGL
jgi:hypothetical protein